MIKQNLRAVKVGAFSLDEQQISFDESAQDAIKAFEQREGKLVEKLHSFDEVTGENKALKIQISELETKVSGMISKDDVGKMVQDLSEVQSVMKSYGMDEVIETPIEGMKLVVSKVYPTQSFDEAEILGAYKTIKKNEKDAKEIVKSNEALKGVSTDNIAGKSVKFSQIDLQSLKKRRA